MPTNLPELREDMIIDAVLMHCVSLGIADKIRDNTSVRYGTMEDGRLRWSPTPESEEALEHIAIDLGDGRTRFFRRVNNEPAGADGFSGSAWVETNSQGEILHVGRDGRPLPANAVAEIRFEYPGYENDLGTAAGIETGGLSNQVDSVPGFIDRTMDNARAMGITTVGRAHVGAHSLGAPLAEVSHLYLETQRDMRANVVMMEPWGEASGTIARRLGNPDSQLSRQIWTRRNPNMSEAEITAMLNANTISVNEVDDTGRQYTFVNQRAFTDGNQRVGEQVHLNMGPVEGMDGFTDHKLRNIIARLETHPDALSNVDAPAPPAPAPVVAAAAMPTHIPYTIAPGSGMAQMMRATFGPVSREMEHPLGYAMFFEALRIANRDNPQALEGLVDREHGWQLTRAGGTLNLPTAQDMAAVMSSPLALSNASLAAYRAPTEGRGQQL